MSSVIICGGSVVGLTTAMMLARDGHEVTVLERDEVPAASAGKAWDGWERSGVAQFRQPQCRSPGAATCWTRSCPA